MFNEDVSTGKVAINSSLSASNGTSIYMSSGNSSALTSGDVPIVFEKEVKCYFWDILETCTPVQTAMFANGSAITKDWILTGYKLADGTAISLNGSGGGANNTTTAPQVPNQATNGAGLVAMVPGFAFLTMIIAGLQLVGL